VLPCGPEAGPTSRFALTHTWNTREKAFWLEVTSERTKREGLSVTVH
jgi:hypothetical protein